MSRPYLDIAGHRFGRLVVLERAFNFTPGPTRWVCQCDCGKKKTVRMDGLRRGSTTSCGCYAVEAASISGKSRKTHGKSGSKIYMVYVSMKARCYNSNNKRYERYGGRGIKVCERWLASFENFYEDMGDPPPGLTLERENNDGNYEPGNCKWATPTEQMRNRSHPSTWSGRP